MMRPRSSSSRATAALPCALLCALLLLVAAAPVAQAGIFPSFPSLVPTGARDATNKACACIDGGMGSPECASGVSSYCEGQTGAAAAACAAANRFFGQKSTPDAPAAAGLLSTACAVAVPEKANACACLEVRVRCGCACLGRVAPPPAAAERMQCTLPLLSLLPGLLHMHSRH